MTACTVDSGRAADNGKVATPSIHIPTTTARRGNVEPGGVMPDAIWRSGFSRILTRSTASMSTAGSRMTGLIGAFPH
jgi:hypothetical protein